MYPWADKVMEESGGRLKIELYPAMQLGNTPSLYDQIRDGVIDGGWALPAYTPGRFPESEAFELPLCPQNLRKKPLRRLGNMHKNICLSGCPMSI